MAFITHFLLPWHSPAKPTVEKARAPRPTGARLAAFPTAPVDRCRFEIQVLQATKRALAAARTCVPGFVREDVVFYQNLYEFLFRQGDQVVVGATPLLNLQTFLLVADFTWRVNWPLVGTIRPFFSG